MKFIIGRFKSFKCIQHIYLLIPYHVSVIMLGNGKIKLSNDRYSSEICIYIYIYKLKIPRDQDLFIQIHIKSQLL